MAGAEGVFKVVEGGEAMPGQEVKGIQASLKIWEFVPRSIGSHGRVLSEGGPDSKEGDNSEGCSEQGTGLRSNGRV